MQAGATLWSPYRACTCAVPPTSSLPGGAVPHSNNYPGIIIPSGTIRYLVPQNPRVELYFLPVQVHDCAEESPPSAIARSWRSSVPVQ